MRLRELLFQVGLLLLAIVLGKIFDSPFGYLVAAILSVAFVVQWLIQKDENNANEFSFGLSVVDFRSERPVPVTITATAQPDVSLIWDWPEAERAQKRAAGLTEKHILLHNRSNEYVYNIRIQPIRLSQELVFDEINEIAPRQQYPVLARWDGRSSQTTNYIYYFAGNEEEARKRGMIVERKGRLDNFFFAIPIVLTYEAGKAVWETICEFRYDPGEDSSFV